MQGASAWLSAEYSAACGTQPEERGEEDSVRVPAHRERADRLALAFQSKKPIDSRYQARSVGSVRNVALVRYYRQD